MLGEMTASELMEWQIYFSVEPFTVERLEIAIGLSTMHNASMHVDKKVSLKDYMMNYIAPAKSEMDEKTIRHNAMMWAQFANRSQTNGK